MRDYTALAALAAGVVVVVLVAARSDGVEKKTDPVARGRKIYGNICIACHHPDPHKEYGTTGTWGPPVADSSLELIRMRVLTTSYPKGYKPKRDTKHMKPIDFLKDDQLRALHAYLNDPSAGKPEDDETVDDDSEDETLEDGDPKKGR